MVMYWPKKPSMDLNLAVANIFIQTYQKLNIPLSILTHKKSPINIFNPNIQKQLLLCTLLETEILILDIIELNLQDKDINNLNHQILYDLINKTMCQFIAMEHSN